MRKRLAVKNRTSRLLGMQRTVQTRVKLSAVNRSIVIDLVVLVKRRHNSPPRCGLLFQCVAEGDQQISLQSGLQDIQDEVLTRVACGGETPGGCSRSKNVVSASLTNKLSMLRLKLNGTPHRNDSVRDPSTHLMSAFDFPLSYAPSAPFCKDNLRTCDTIRSLGGCAT